MITLDDLSKENIIERVDEILLIGDYTEIYYSVIVSEVDEDGCNCDDNYDPDCDAKFDNIDEAYDYLISELDNHNTKSENTKEKYLELWVWDDSGNGDEVFMDDFKIDLMKLRQQTINNIINQ